ncbi:hypothetical protein F5X99DRAFT_237370 [Biscogniauxia marginata]|nr:hypothetical protein F5X99DRAFT_237370 [Biscogniauxia marginata]
MGDFIEKKILVIGATGNQGTGVVHHCTSARHIVYAFVRDLHSKGATRLKHHYSVPLLQGDVDDADSLKTAMDGIDTVFFIITQAGADIEDRRTRNVVAAAQASRSVSTIIFSSALWTGEHETFPDWGAHHPMYQYWVGKHRSENIVRDAGLKHWIIVRPAMFLQDFIPPISNRLFPDLTSNGTLRVGLKKGSKINVVGAADVGLVAAAAISRPEQYSGKAIELSLPSLTIQELADKMFVASGIPVEVKYVDVNDLAAELGERLVASQRLFSFIGCHPFSEKSSQDFSLTSPEAFFRREYVHSGHDDL